MINILLITKWGLPELMEKKRNSTHSNIGTQET
jgi:hypothetical protein